LTSYSTPRNVIRLAQRNFRSSLDREFLIIQLVLPLFFIFVAGFGYTLIVPRVEGVSYETFLATGAVAMTVMSSSMLSGTMIWFDRNFGMFEQILMGPFTRLQYVVSVALTIVLTGIMSSTVVFLVSILVSPGLILSVRSILELFGSLILGSLFFGGFGIRLPPGEIERSACGNYESHVFWFHLPELGVLPQLQ